MAVWFGVNREEFKDAGQSCEAPAIAERLLQ
ncbi:hypothetical protein HaLaN_08351, partial [Haematococcus lacustris]